MRLKRSRIKQYSHKTATPKKDREGSSFVEYGSPETFFAEVWPADGKLQAEMYGQRLPYIRNCRIVGKYEVIADADGKVTYQFDGMALREGDGVCLCVPAESEPDYKVIAIRPYVPLYIEVEKL